jgi:uncharacterized protein YukE
MAEITMDVAGVREAANQLRANIKTQAETTKSHFHGVHVRKGALGSTPGAAAFVAQHQAAQELYDQTIQQVIDDLENIAAALVASADTMGDTEESARRALTKLDPSQLAPETRAVYVAQVKAEGNVLDPGAAADNAAKAADLAAPVPAQSGATGEAGYE